MPEERSRAWDLELGSRPRPDSRGDAEANRLAENDIGTVIVDAAVKIHRALGPGLLESVYEVVLSHELRKRGLGVERQVTIPIEYDGLRFDEGFRADLIVQDRVIVELKAVEHLNNAHKKQLHTYLRLTGCRLGYLLNFSEALMKDGIHRVVNALPE
jgi:GxxExxY protein